LGDSPGLNSAQNAEIFAASKTVSVSNVARKRANSRAISAKTFQLPRDVALLARSKLEVAITTSRMRRR